MDSRKCRVWFLGVEGIEPNNSQGNHRVWFLGVEGIEPNNSQGNVGCGF